MAGGDTSFIRTALRLELNDNSLTSADLHATLNWAKGKVPKLFDPYKEGAFSRETDSNRQHWDLEYYDMQNVYLKHNYSEKRLLHLIEVRDTLREQKVDGFAPDR